MLFCWGGGCARGLEVPSPANLILGALWPILDKSVVHFYTVFYNRSQYCFLLQIIYKTDLLLMPTSENEKPEDLHKVVTGHMAKPRQLAILYLQGSRM